MKVLFVLSAPNAAGLLILAPGRTVLTGFRPVNNSRRKMMKIIDVKDDN